MTFEYADNLNQLMALSKQDVRVKKQWETAKSTIANIRKQLLDDAVLTNHFTAMTKEIALFLDGVKHFDQNTLNSLINKFSDESKQLAKFHKKISQLAAATPPTFSGIEAMLEKHKAAMASAINVEALNASKNWISQMLVEKSLMEIDDQLGKFSDRVKASFLFSEQQWIASLRQRCTMAKTASDISAIYQEVSKRQNLLAEIAKIENALVEMRDKIYFKEAEVGKQAYTADMQSIKQHFATLEQSQNLSKREVDKVIKQLEAKHVSVKDIQNRDYPSLDFVDVHSGNWVLSIPINLVIFLLNCIIVLVGWPIIFSSRAFEVDTVIKKNILLW